MSDVFENPGAAADLNSAWRRRFQKQLLAWYQTAGRLLPWRSSADPYRIWISEIMLQQTTVAAVVPYFDRFLLRFPNVHALAKAEQSEVLRLWEGLGYYSRARNLHRAAGQIVTDLGGRFPDDAAELARLPGIGRYTAGAIASFAFGQPAAIVEANTLRLYSRLMAMEADPRSGLGQKSLWQFAEWLVSSLVRNGHSPADFNQAVMDLGSAICRPVDPQCGACPVAKGCQAFLSGTQDRIPVLKPRVAITDVTEVSLAVRRDHQLLLRQRQEGERWAGLWDFVRFEITDESSAGIRMPGKTAARKHASKKSARTRSLFDSEPPDAEFADAGSLTLPTAWRDRVEELTGLTIDRAKALVEIRHAITRYRIRLLCFETCEPAGRIRAGSGYRWFRLAQVPDLPLSTTARQLAVRLE